MGATNSAANLLDISLDANEKDRDSYPRLCQF
jgi:hypothetical protein